MTTVYEQVEALARPVVQHYWDDVRVHDRRAFAGAVDGDMFLWAPRRCGSHLVTLVSAADGPAGVSAAKRYESARDWFHAVEATFSPDQWYLVEVLGKGGADGRVRPISTGRALAYVEALKPRAVRP